MIDAQRLMQVVEALLEPATIDAVVRDGWPRPMAEAGFALHRQTWDVPAIAAAAARERASVPATEPPANITHVWPALPGAGVTPVLYGALLGVPRQRIKPSSRGRAFGQRFVEVWRRFDATVELAGDLGEAERYVVSGSDETLAALIGRFGEERIVGYGDRQSFAVVVDDGNAERHVDALATDVVMWFGRGCFSARAVLFVGNVDAGARFGAALADAIARRERELAPEISEGMFAERAQKLGVAEFQTTVWPARLGWVELREQWDGAARSADVVVLCVCDAPEHALAVPATHLQGVAWAGPGRERAAALGVTRVCAPGELQAPPGDWPHDGVSNVAALLGLHSGRI